MILKNGFIYSEGLLQNGVILILKGVIRSVIYDITEQTLQSIRNQNTDGIEINCEKRTVIPGIIDIHSHLRDMEQREKETFLTGTLAAAFSGITTVFTMPNTKPPAISANQVKSWMEKAHDSIHVDVGFIAGIPRDFNLEEIISIIDLGVVGFKIYPLNSLNGIDWTDHLNIQKLLNISSKFQLPIFIHPDWPLNAEEKEKIFQEDIEEKLPFLKLHNKLYPTYMEAKYVNFILENYYKVVVDLELTHEDYPIIHFCHISCQDSYSLIKKALSTNKFLKITFEITPHHLLLDDSIQIENPNYAKVLPPLRDKKHASYLFQELKQRNIKLLGTDHAPHTSEEKNKAFLDAPSGFPGFESYPLLILNQVFKHEIPLESFVKITSENPAKIFNLNNKGFIKAGYDADLIIVDSGVEYPIDSKQFKSKAKFSPYQNYQTSVHIWKVFLRGIEVNIDESKPMGNVIKGPI
ncbi:MAG: dihydroorotase [Promethearchaeota archaeon]